MPVVFWLLETSWCWLFIQQLHEHLYGKSLESLHKLIKMSVFCNEQYLFRHSNWFIKTHVQIIWRAQYENTDKIGRSQRVSFIYSFCITIEKGRQDTYTNKVAAKLFSSITYQTSFISWKHPK